ncbi:MAG TPA: zf-TFIIB domain-containing protein [Methylomirabilota bacterium]|jgi:Zn-finger nucleic acid-binding protein|nr:zf-TFIIB domain-containing protein [Methylomirabilota bacterium]
MKCPKCRTESFTAFSWREVTVDRCASCHGIWFDEQELPQLLSAGPRQLTPLLEGSENEDLNSKRGNCPRDGSPLVRMYSAINRSVVVDICLDCRGIWLDGGEFEKLLIGRQA